MGCLKGREGGILTEGKVVSEGKGRGYLDGGQGGV